MQDDDGCSLLMQAINLDNDEMASFLIEAGADEELSFENYNKSF